MRCETAWPILDFFSARKLNWHLEAKYPEIFVPKYAMVTFHRIPYATAQTRGQIQDRMLAELCDGVSSLDELDWTKADRLIRARTDSTGDRVSLAFISSSEEFAREMDARDPLAHFRERFHIPKVQSGQECIYLCGHSLGLQPKSDAAYMRAGTPGLGGTGR